MLDIKFVRDFPGKVEASLKKRGSNFDIKKLVKLDDERKKIVFTRDEARREQKDASHDKKNITALKKLKEKFKELDQKEREISVELEKLLISLPNITDDEVPPGAEDKNIEIDRWGKIKKFDYKPKDHLALGTALGLLDFERGVKVSGSRFYFIKNDLALLSRAVLELALDKLQKNGFTLMLSPHIVTEKSIWGKGMLTQEEIDLNIYKIEGEDKYLIGTGEIPLTAYRADETIPTRELPLKYCTITQCFRKEAGTYGKHAKGLFRVHQFEKLEMYQYVEPPQSDAALSELVAIEEEIMRALEIPYRVMLVAAGDMAGYLFKQYDIEYWSPVDQTYREIMSAGNARDFQARRLNIKYKGKDGADYVHTLNATAAAVSRILIAIMENYQTEDGKILVPKALHPYMNKTLIG